jgi:hypothetical protein
MTDIVKRLTAKDNLTSIITSVWCKVGRHPGELADLMKEAADEITRLRAENEKLRDAYDTDALTISYNLGYTCGKDIAKDEIEKLHREAAIRIDQIEREQEAHLRTIADYNRSRVQSEKLRSALEPFARMAADYEDWETEKITMIVLLYHLRAAATAIRESGDD